MGYRIVVLASGSGTLLQSLLDAQKTGKLAGEIVAVGSDIDNAQALTRAKQAHIATFCVALNKSIDREIWDLQLANNVAKYQPDLVICAGFMRLLGPNFLAQFEGKTINSHPALLPAFPGIHGPRDALNYGVKITGATVFMVDAGVDTGRILAQVAVPVLADDDVETLHERIKVAERVLLVETVNELIANAS